MAATTFQFTTPKRPNRYLKAFWYGPFGAGKTFLAATAQDCEPFQDVFFVDVESGDMTLEEEWPDMPIVQIHSFSDLARIYEFLRIHHKLRAQGDEEKLLEFENRFWPEDKQVETPHHFNSVVIDSLSEVQGYLHNVLMNITEMSKLDDEMIKTGWDEFNLSIHKMRQVVRSFRDLPMHVILVGGEQEKGEPNRIYPNFEGKLVSDLPGFMDVVGRLVATEPNKEGVVTRRLYLTNGPNFKAKSRKNLKVPYLENPSMTTVAKAFGIIK